MYIVIVGNSIEATFRTFKQAEKECRARMELVHETIPVYIAKMIVKDGVVIDK